MTTTTLQTAIDSLQEKHNTIKIPDPKNSKFHDVY